MEFIKMTEGGLSCRSLVRLQYRQAKRSRTKGTKFGYIFGVLYIWVIEFVLFFALRSEGVEVPALVTVAVCAAFLIPDFLLKLAFIHDNTVMNAFLKTRPVPQESWDRYLTLSQFWKIENLEMPLMLSPACFLFMPIGLGLVMLPVIYLFSVFGGFLIMLIKHKGNYQPETRAKATSSKAVKPVRGKHIYGLQTRSFLRSRRLRTAVIYLGILFYIQCICYSLNDEMNFSSTYLILFIALMSLLVTQYGFAVEANFFGAIWTKPLAIRRLIYDKFRFSVSIGAIATLLCLPVCFWSDISPLTILAYFLYTSGTGNLIYLIDPYRCSKLDLFGKTFFNYQGSSGTFKGSTFIGTLVIMGSAVAAAYLLPERVMQAVLSGLGIAGFCIYRPFFRWVERKFLRNRYEYMEKYRSI